MYFNSYFVDLFGMVYYSYSCYIYLIYIWNFSNKINIAYFISKITGKI